MTTPIRSIKSAKSAKSKSQKQLNLNEIQQPQKVKVLILTQQKLVYQQYYFLKNFYNIIKLDLSYNKINIFPQGFTFKNFGCLRTLFLHYNRFQKLRNLELLAECRLLVYFTLFGNPLEQTLARHFCLNIMPWLKLMDDKPVKQQQKYEGILNLVNKQYPNQKVGFPIVQNINQGNSIQFLSNVVREINIARQMYLSINPIVRIQKWWKNKYRKIIKYRNFISEEIIAKKQQNKVIKNEDNVQNEGDKKMRSTTKKVIQQRKQTIPNSYTPSVIIKRNTQLRQLPKENQLNQDQNQQEPSNQSQSQQQQQQLDQQAKQQLKTKREQNQRLISNKLKILNFFKYYLDGFKSIKLLLNQQTSLFVSKEYCIRNGHKFKEVLSFKNKILKVYRLPHENQKYQKEKQKQKHFLSLIFYNNFHYLLELKSKRCYFLNQSKSQSQLKNSNLPTEKKLQTNQSKNYTSRNGKDQTINPVKKQNKINFQQNDKQQIIQIHNPHEYVQIDMDNQQKLALIKFQYVKLKSQNKQKQLSEKDHQSKQFHFPFLFGINVLKISSAIKIQKIWRGYKVRKTSNLLKSIKQKFSAIKIQKWIRKLKFKNRQLFLINSYNFLKNNQSPNIIMKLELFAQIQKICEEAYKRPEIFLLPFQNCGFQIVEKEKTQFEHLQKDQQNIAQPKKRSQFFIKLNAQRQPFPSYFQKLINCYQLSSTTNPQSQQSISNKIMDLLLKGSKSIFKFNSISNSKQKFDSISIQYHSKQQAIQRKFLICLLTYNFKTKKWIKFESQRNLSEKHKLTDVNQKIKDAPFLKMVYDNNKKEKLFQKIYTYTKQIRNQSQILWIPIKMRYFQGTVDFSAIIITGFYKKYFGIEEEKQPLQNSQNKYELYSERKRMKELKSQKSFTTKIVLTNMNNDIILPKQNLSNLSRNNYSFWNHQETVELQDKFYRKNYYQYKNNQYLRSLHSDQSHASLDWSENSSPMHSLNNYGSSLPLRNSQIVQSSQKSLAHDWRVSPQLFEKKSFIQNLKNSHKQKLLLLSELKRKKNQQMKQIYKKNQQQNKKLIKQSLDSSLNDNINKVNRIKAYEKSRSFFKQQAQGFQGKFLRKGNISMKLQMKQFQKNRSKSNIQQKQVPLKKSARYQSNQIQQKKKNFSKDRQYHSSLKNSVLKTQLKQFSIQLSQGGQFGSYSLHQHDSYPDISLAVLNEHKKSKQLRKQGMKRSAMNSATSEKITKLYQQKKRQLLRSEQSQDLMNNHQGDGNKQDTGHKIVLRQNSQNKHSQQIQTPPQVIINAQPSHNQMQEQLKKAIQKQKKKMLKKKKVVHSVFPQQFFPLKDSQQIGFHLPRINRENK